MTALHATPALAALWLGTALAAADAPLPDELHMLAICEARYAAVVRHSWLVRDGSEAAAMRRDLFAAMADALVAPAPDRARLERDLILLRLSERNRTSRLLDSARHGSDARHSRIARGRVSQVLATCDRIAIGRPPTGA